MRRIAPRGALASIGALVAVLAIAAAAPLAAQSLEDYDYENLGFRGAGVELGRIWPGTVEATESYGFRMDLGFLGPAIRISPVVSYWKSSIRDSELERLAQKLSETGAVITGDDLEPIEWSDLSVGVDVQSVWITPLRSFTYFGAGIGLHALNGQGAAVEDTFVEDLLDSFAPGVDVFAGFELAPISYLRAFAEARYTVMSELKYPGLRVGGMIVLPAPVGEKR